MVNNKSGIFRTPLRKLIGAVLAIFIICYLAFTLSPWPYAMIIRYAFEADAVKVNEALSAYVPKGISEQKDLKYDFNDNDALLDIYSPKIDKDSMLPAIVWVHGGGWISGNKRHIENYSKILASNNYVVVSIDYSVAPGKKYPTPVKQVNTALKYLSENAPKFRIDKNHFILAGDSGGAHIVSQIANIIYSPEYAERIGIYPNINPSQVSGLLLYCGPYGTKDVNMEGAFAGFLKTVLWSYSGKKDFLNDTTFKTASVVDYISSNYPPAFISAGNADPLLSHSQSLARKLESLHVKIDTLFFPKNYTPAVPHEYQFNLSNDAGKQALRRSLEFLKGLD